MSTKWTLNEKSVGELTVTIEGEEWKKAVEKSFNKIVKTVSLPGFRKGQAPKALVEKRITKEAQYAQAMDDNAQTWFEEALKAENLEPISRPELMPGDMDEDHCELKFTFAVEPEANVLVYKGLKYEVGDTEVTDAEIEEEIDRMRERYADTEVKEDAAAEGDIVNIDYEGFVDDVAFDGGSAKGYDLTLGSGQFIPGFEDQLIGTKAGEDKDVVVKFPEDYGAADLAGKEAVFKCKVNEVKTKVLPEIDDDFAQDLSIQGVETAAQLRDNVRERLSSRKKSDAESKAENDLIEELISNTEVEIPDVMVEDEARGMLQEFAQQIQYYGQSLSSYLEMTGMKPQDLMDQYKDDAKKRVTYRLALKAVARKEGLSVTDEEVENEIKDLSEKYSMTVEEIKKVVSPELLKEDKLMSKALDFIKENAEK